MLSGLSVLVDSHWLTVLVSPDFIVPELPIRFCCNPAIDLSPARQGPHLAWCRHGAPQLLQRNGAARRSAGRSTSHFWPPTGRRIDHLPAVPGYTARPPNVKKSGRLRIVGIARINLACPTSWALSVGVFGRRRQDRPAKVLLTFAYRITGTGRCE